MSQYNSPLGKGSLFGQKAETTTSDFESPLGERSLFNRKSVSNLSTASIKGELTYSLAIRDNGNYLLAAQWSPLPGHARKREYRDENEKLRTEMFKTYYFWNVHIDQRKGSITSTEHYWTRKVYGPDINSSDDYHEESKLYNIPSLKRAHPRKLYEMYLALRHDINSLNPANILTSWKGLARGATSKNITDYAGATVLPTLLNFSPAAKVTTASIATLNALIQIYQNAKAVIVLDPKAFKHKE